MHFCSASGKLAAPQLTIQLPSIRCLACSAKIAADSRFCQVCGHAISSLSQMPTAAGDAASPVVAPRAGRMISSDSVPVGFTPGAILADRYRIIGLLGRGGMGEVYRADDLKLGQPVALKFLPASLASDPARRERFFAEVRITRQLSHPNICRVYDIAEFDGRHFLSMEYIDGEDLASLIKRIGYLSNEKVLEIARQLAAGLAAAHDRGVLHRDLKPANIMLDGHGRVRITDFGLAIVAADETQAAEIVGTPAYMAPEQFAGKGGSVRSDIYALGLVLYEICCGKQAFTAASIAEIIGQKDVHTPRSPSEIREGVNPVIERLIMRCLERDPRARPASVAQLAAALPGGDPVAAAIAAGETPSPEMVAASGLKEGLRPAVALGLVAFVIVASIAVMWMKGSTDLLQRVAPGKPPDALIERTRELIQKAGYPDQATDSAFGFSYDQSFIQYVQNSDKSAGRWKKVEKFNPVIFWYRQSPRALERLGMFLPVFAPSEVTTEDPPLQFSGEALVRLDIEGRLRTFEAIPPSTESVPGPAPAMDWTMLFSEAGLDISKWMPVAPLRNPRFYADARAAWHGSIPDLTNTPIRVEAAAYHGKPVSFEIVGPWTTARADAVTLPTPNKIAKGINLLFLIVFIGAGLFFARRNVRLGRGDRRGAIRLVLFVLGLGSGTWLFREHHVGTPWELGLLYMAVGAALFGGGLLAVFYIALEPFVRRRWPQILVSWTRLLSGEWRDPLVGRDVLVGCVGGLTVTSLAHVAFLMRSWLNYPALVTFSLPLGPVMGNSSAISQLCFFGAREVIDALAIVFLFFLLRILSRKDWIATVAFIVIASVPNIAAAEPRWVIAPFVVAAVAILLFLLMRFGLLALGIALFIDNVFNVFPITLRPSAWYSSIGFAALFVVAVLTLYGFRTSLSGRPLLEMTRVGD